MNRNTKIILGIIGGLLLVCVCVVGAFLLVGGWITRQAFTMAEQNTSTKPEDVAAIATSITGFDQPAGYTAEYGLQFFGFALAGYSSSSGDGHMMLIQFPTSTRLDAAEMERQLRQAARNRRYSWMDVEMKVIEQKPIDVRGQQATLTISEGVNSQNETYQQASVVFQGKGGPAMLVFVAPAGEFDRTLVDQLIESFR